MRIGLQIVHVHVAGICGNEAPERVRKYQGALTAGLRLGEPDKKVRSNT